MHRTNVPVQGFLFQKGVLVDALNLAENIALSLRASGQPHPVEAIDSALEAVGLSGTQDGTKMPGEVQPPTLRAPCSLAPLMQLMQLTPLRPSPVYTAVGWHAPPRGARPDPRAAQAARHP